MFRIALAAVSVALLHTAAATGNFSSPITMNERSIVIDGKPTLIMSGAIHYARVHEGEWDGTMKLAKQMGLNTIQTYVMWNFHEQHLTQYGTPDFAGRANLSRFIEVAAQNDLFVTVRIGPYICGEYYFGGIPTWLRTFGGIKCMRCADPVWEHESMRWVARVVKEITPQLHSNGGNVVMLQIENEFAAGSGTKQDYLKWSVEHALSLTPKSDVPWNLCHDLTDGCSAVNRNGAGAYDYQVLCTINGFWMDEYTKDFNQPSPKWLFDLRQKNPGQPSIWTEDQGWFDQWGVAQRVRVGSDQLYGIARFFAFGGSWHNFYMVTGGNNYGLQSGGEVVTAYAPDTVVDSLLLRHEPRYSTYSKFFHTMAKVAPIILAAPLTNGTAFPAAPPPPGSVTAGVASLGHCTSDDPAHRGTLDASQRWSVDASPTARIENNGTALCLAEAAGTDDDAADGVLLQKCDGSKAVTISYDKATSQIQSATKQPCKKKGATGMCKYCLDAGASGNDLTWWDCKKPSDPEQGNQQWTYSNLKGLVHGGSKDASCLTALGAKAGGTEYHEYGDIAFLSNKDDTHSFKVTYKGKPYTLSNHSVSIVNGATGEVLFSTAQTVQPAHTNALAPPAPSAAAWSYSKEGVASKAGKPVTSPSPVEQLNLTENDSDYMWYTATVTAAESYTVKHESGGGTMFYIYVDGQLVAPRKLSNSSVQFAHPQLPRGAARASSSTLQILSVAMGVSNGVGGPVGSHQKGITGPVKVNGAAVTGWTHTWPLAGEDKQWFSSVGAGSIDTPVTAAAPGANASLLWFKASLDLPPSAPAATQVSYAMDLGGMNKGNVWVNGFHLGRYYLKNGQCSGKCAPPIKSGHCYMHWHGCGKPTQHLYHIPKPVLKKTGNLVVLFEETAEVNDVWGGRDLASVKMVALHEHPPLN